MSAEAIERKTPDAMARIGFAARGTIYSLVGGDSLLAALHFQQSPHGFSGVVHEVIRQPAGAFAVGVLAVGLACFGGWLAIRGLTAARHAGGTAKRFLFSIAMVADAAFYSGFVAVVLGQVLGARGGGERSVHLWTAWLLQQNLGRWAAGAVGVTIICGGIGIVIWAWTTDVERAVALAPTSKRITETVSRYGLTGRGAALILVGGYAIAAAINADPSKAHGLGGVLQHVRRTAYGDVLLAVFASAFFASAFFDFIEALYRRGGAEVPKAQPVTNKDKLH